MTRLLIVVAASSLVLAATVAPAAPVAPPPREVLLYFPTTIGAKWVYVWRSERWKDKEVTETVVAVEAGADGTELVTVGQIEVDGRTYPTEKVEVSDKGMYWAANLTGVGGFPYPWCQLKLPQRTGQNWKMLPWDDTMLVDRGVERIQVPAGEFDAVRVEQMVPRYPTAPVQTWWYARGVGKVKATQGDGRYLTIVLKSFSAGKGRAP